MTISSIKKTFKQNNHLLSITAAVLIAITGCASPSNDEAPTDTNPTTNAPITETPDTTIPDTTTPDTTIPDTTTPDTTIPDTTIPDEKTSVDISGIAIDGYLQNALVCLDKNNNKTCDTDEPQTTTDVDGKFSFTTTTDIANLYPIISVITDLTKDADFPNRSLTPYVMSTPAGKGNFITPFTSMIQTEIESNPGITVNEAVKRIKIKLGFTADSPIDLFADYIAIKNDLNNINSSDYKRLHRIAQVITRILENNSAATNNAATDAGLNKNDVSNELTRLVIKKIIANIETIIEEVDKTEISAIFDPDMATKNTAIAVDTSTIKEDIATEINITGATVTDVAELLKTGMYTIFNNPEENGRTYDRTYTISIIKADETAVKTFISLIETWDGTAWVSQLLPSNQNKNCQTLSNNGLTTYPCDSGIDALINNNDKTMSSILYDNDGNIVREVLLSATETNIEDSLIRNLLNNNSSFKKAVPGSAIFTGDALYYRLKITEKTDSYEVDYDEADKNKTCKDKYGDDIQTTNCKTLNSLTGATIATTLADVIIQDKKYFIQNDTVSFMPNENDTKTGIVIFHTRDQGNSYNKTGSTPYTISTPFNGNIDILSFNTPASNFNVFTGQQTFIFIDGGYARTGTYTQKNSTSNFPNTFDTNAITDIKNCFLGGIGDGSCAVRLFLKDGQLPRVNGEVVSSIELNSIVPFQLPENSTLEYSTDNTIPRWTIELGDVNTTTTPSNWRNGTLAPTQLNDAGKRVPQMKNGAVKVLNMRWKVTGNKRLKIERTYTIKDDTVTRKAGTYNDVWIITQLLDGKTHLRFKRYNQTLNNKLEISFGSYVTLL